MTTTTPRPTKGPTRAPIDPRIRQRLVAVKRDAGRRRLRLLLGGLALVALALLTVLALRSPWLSVSRIELVGASPATTAQLRAVAGTARGRPMISVASGSIVRAEEALPWVESASVRRSWPSTLIVSVRLRHPVAEVRDGTGWAEVDPTGRVVAVVPHAPRGLIALSGAITVVAPGGAVPTSLRGPLEVAAAVPGSVAGQVVTVGAGAHGQVSVGLSDGATVDLGPPTDLAAKLSSLATVLSEVDMNGVRTVDLQIPDQPALTRG